MALNERLADCVLLFTTMLRSETYYFEQTKTNANIPHEINHLRVNLY